MKTNINLPNQTELLTKFWFISAGLVRFKISGLVMCVDCISLHGLVRGENMELGSDSDTGGQVTLYSKLSISSNLEPPVLTLFKNVR